MVLTWAGEAGRGRRSPAVGQGSSSSSRAPDGTLRACVQGALGLWSSIARDGDVLRSLRDGVLPVYRSRP